MKNRTLALLASACILVACQEKQTAPETAIRFYARETLTKTVFGDLTDGKYPILWQGTDYINISYKMGNSTMASVSPLIDGKTAEFTLLGAPTAGDEPGNVYYALSPAAAQEKPINYSLNRWQLTIPASQTPFAGSVDPSAQILFSRYDAGEVSPTSVPFEFEHVTAYGLLSFSNLSLDAGEVISSVTLTAAVKWVGTWFYYVKDYDSDGVGPVDYPAGTTAPLSKSAYYDLVITTSSFSGIWFACAPVDLQNKTLTAQITTNLGTYTKAVTFPTGRGTFLPGYVARFSINMNGVGRVVE